MLLCSFQGTALPERLRCILRAGLRFGVPEDKDFIMALEKDALRHPWSEEAVSGLLSHDTETGNSRKFAVIAEDAGYIGLSAVLDEAEVGNIVVAPSKRNKGIGRDLIEAACEELKANGVTVLYLEVESGNAPAVHLYEKMGFAVYNTRKDYYGQGFDALLMRKLL